MLVWSSSSRTAWPSWPTRCPIAPPRSRRVQARLVDLLPIVRGTRLPPRVHGLVLLKRVAPVLAPAVGYDDLEGVADGGAAATALVRLARGMVESAEEEAALRRALLEYCRRDTLALVEVHAELRRRAPAP